MPNIEEQIQRAMAEGKFDDLPGKGRPLRLDENPYADPEWQLAYHMLKENGFSLPWIELRQELESELAAARQALAQAWEWRQSAAADTSAQAAYRDALQKFSERIARLNQRISDYNLQAPLAQFQMRRLDPDREIKNICG